ncbi:MAG TPA: hypothetical protein VIM55_19690 [Mucilaginibacter sp.]
MESEFFNSLSIICDYYGLTKPSVTAYLFPQNIYQAWQSVARQIKTKEGKLDCIIMADDKHRATLATIRQMNTGTTLYYIPVRPLWNWMKKTEQKPIADLVTAIFAYLHQVVEIPFYTGRDSYVSYQYDTIEQWINDAGYDEDDEEEKEWQQIQLDALYVAQNSGLHIYRAIIQPECLINFRQAITSFEASNTCDLEWLGIANEFYELYENYPKRSVYDNIRPDLYHPEEDERISVGQYMSFYWSGADCLTDTLDTMINDSFQEISIMDEPIAVQVFDGVSPITNETFEFETKLFDLLNRLSTLLNPYDYEEREPTI